MKTIHAALLPSTLALSVLLSVGCAGSPKRSPVSDPEAAKVQFARIAALEGSWYEADGSQEAATLIYEMTSGGSVVLETTFPGAPHEMRTLYFVHNDVLTLVHYCAIGNRPRMVANSWDAGSLHFSLDGDGGLESPDEMHMHSASFSFLGPDTLQTSWALFDQGEQTADHGSKLIRRSEN